MCPRAPPRTLRLLPVCPRARSACPTPRSLPPPPLPSPPGSRSHAIFTVIFRQRELTVGDGSGSGGRAAAAPAASGKAARHNEKVSKISMVDLAGSERIHLSQVQKSDARLREAKNINRSLATLCDVIKALADAAQAAEAQPPGAAASAKAPFVPYRNSVLTWLLKESLGGNAKTTMLACVSPCDVHYEESISTLKYAERAKRVRNRAVVNECVGRGRWRWR